MNPEKVKNLELQIQNMEKEKILEISQDVENKPNKELFLAVEFLVDEFEKTKELIIDLTRHLEGIENLYNSVNDELKKRTKR